MKLLIIHFKQLRIVSFFWNLCLLKNYGTCHSNCYYFLKVDFNCLIVLPYHHEIAQMEGTNLFRGDMFLPFICCAYSHPISFIPPPLQKQTFEAFLFSCNQGCHTRKVTDMIWMKPGGKIHDLRQSKNF